MAVDTLIAEWSCWIHGEPRLLITLFVSDRSSFSFFKSSVVTFLFAYSFNNAVPGVNTLLALSYSYNADVLCTLDGYDARLTSIYF